MPVACSSLVSTSSAQPASLTTFQGTGSVCSGKHATLPLCRYSTRRRAFNQVRRLRRTSPPSAAPTGVCSQIAHCQAGSAGDFSLALTAASMLRMRLPLWAYHVERGTSGRAAASTSAILDDSFGRWRESPRGMRGAGGGNSRGRWWTPMDQAALSGCSGNGGSWSTGRGTSMAAASPGIHCSTSHREAPSHAAANNSAGPMTSRSKSSALSGGSGSNYISNGGGGSIRNGTSHCPADVKAGSNSSSIAIPESTRDALRGSIVALGKFDALHIGHRALAIRAAQLGGYRMPVAMLSFAGMAEVLGWESRLPLVAACDRKRVLLRWASHCAPPTSPLSSPPTAPLPTPLDLAIDFAAIRSLSPVAFVQLLALELGVRGVVVGANYRFGFRAAGKASDMLQLGTQLGMRVGIVETVTDAATTTAAGDRETGGRIIGSHTRPSDIGTEAGQRAILGGDRRGEEPRVAGAGAGAQVEAVSSTRVRELLAVGDLHTVAALLDRPHRVLLGTDDAVALHSGAEGRELGTGDEGFLKSDGTGLSWLVPKSALLNQLPCSGRYACLAFVHHDDEETDDEQVLKEAKLGSGYVDVAWDSLKVVLEESPYLGRELVLQRWSCLSLELVQLVV